MILTVDKANTYKDQVTFSWDFQRGRNWYNEALKSEQSNIVQLRSAYKLLQININYILIFTYLTSYNVLKIFVQ